MEAWSLNHWTTGEVSATLMVVFIFGSRCHRLSEEWGGPAVWPGWSVPSQPEGQDQWEGLLCGWRGPEAALDGGRGPAGGRPVSEYVQATPGTGRVILPGFLKWERDARCVCPQTFILNTSKLCRCWKNSRMKKYSSPRSKNYYCFALFLSLF